MKKTKLCRREFKVENREKRLVFEYEPGSVPSMAEGNEAEYQKYLDEQERREDLEKKRLKDPKEKAKQTAWLNMNVMIESAFNALGNNDDIDKTKAEQFRKNLEDNINAIPADKRQKAALWDEYNEKYGKLDYALGFRFRVSIDKYGNVKVEKQEIGYDEAKKTLTSYLEIRPYNIPTESYDNPKEFKKFNIKKYTAILEKGLLSIYGVYRKIAGLNNFEHGHTINREGFSYVLKVSFDKEGKPAINTMKVPSA